MTSSKRYTRSYFPITANILTPGHLKCIQWLADRSEEVIVGVLTSGALKGYKKELTPYRDRSYLLKTISRLYENVFVVAQGSLDPMKNCRLFRCDGLASGDGFEKVELDAIKRYNMARIDIKLDGEKSKRYASSAIVKKILS